MKKSNMNNALSNYFPEEQPVSLKESNNSLLIGLPKETSFDEKRVVLTPEAVQILITSGYRVIIESGLGDGIHYKDMAYLNVGAILANNESEVYQADLILKIAPPTPFQVDLMKSGVTIMTMLQLSLFPVESIHKLMHKRVNCIAFELITDELNNNPFLNSISEIQGGAAIVIAAQLLSNNAGGKGILLGGVPGISPTEIVILGADLAGTVAARAAIALGAFVKVFDTNINKLRDIQHDLGQSVFTSNLHPKVLKKALISADVVISSMNFINGGNRFLVPNEIVREMKTGAIIIDLSVDQGGCFETTVCTTEKEKFIYEKYGVLHYCVPNVSSAVARTTSFALSNLTVPILRDITDIKCLIDHIKSNPGFRNGVYMYNGKIVNRIVGSYFNLPSMDIGVFFPIMQ